jgi:phage host-nuclease inhibitor protein Gam
LAGRRATYRRAERATVDASIRTPARAVEGSRSVVEMAERASFDSSIREAITKGPHGLICVRG